MIGKRGDKKHKLRPVLLLDLIIIFMTITKILNIYNFISCHSNKNTYQCNNKHCIV